MLLSWCFFYSIFSNPRPPVWPLNFGKLPDFPPGTLLFLNCFSGHCPFPIFKKNYTTISIHMFYTCPYKNQSLQYHTPHTRDPYLFSFSLAHLQQPSISNFLPLESPFCTLTLSRSSQARFCKERFLWRNFFFREGRFLCRRCLKRGENSESAWCCCPQIPNAVVVSFFLVIECRGVPRANYDSLNGWDEWRKNEVKIEVVDREGWTNMKRS